MKTILQVLICTFLFSNLFGQEKRWKPEDIIHTKYVSSLKFSEDGSMIIWSQRKGLKEEDKFVNDLYLARLDLEKDGKIRTFQMTDNKESDHSAFFSKNGESLFFLSSRDKGKKLWKLSLFGGEAKEVYEFKNGIGNIQWLGDDAILFSSSEGKSLYDIEREKDNTQIVEDTLHWNPKRVYSFHFKDKKINRVTTNDKRVGSYAVSKDAKHLVYQIIMSPHYGVDADPKPQYYIQNLETGDSRRILEGMQSPSNFQFTENSEGFYFLATKSSDPEWDGSGIEELYYYDLANHSVQKVPIEWENGVAFSYRLDEDHVITNLSNGPLKMTALYFRTASGWDKREVNFGRSNGNTSILNINSKNNKVAYVYSTASSLPEYYVADYTLDGTGMTIKNEKELVSLNDNLKKKAIAKSEVIYWKGARNEEVNGILYYPKDYEEGKKYPLILSIHGGPTGADQDSWSERWSTYPQIFTDKSAFVLKPNYHGSGQHSLEFIESIKNGNYYHLEEVDIYNGIAHLNEQGKIDMNKLGVMGWSNGAILATWMTLKYPDMFKVCAPGAGDINWTSDYGTCRFGVTFNQSYFGGAPWDDTNGKHFNEWYINNSPIFEIEKIKTPTIIFHGSEDRSVPRDQGWEYYRGLQQVGKAPVKFLWFPGQPHGLQKITHQLRKMNEEIKWIDKFLFGTEKEENEAFKKESPLAMVLENQSNTNEDGFVGTSHNGALVPSFVSLGEDTISVGAYEVTYAQYYASRQEKAPAGKENYPIVGLSRKEISDYLSWLNTLTGKRYRLPNEKEAMAFHKKGRTAAKDQNNLNYWAGYELTQNDVRGLRDKMKELKLDLIKPVGQSKAIKMNDSYIFDLGGNVAECYLKKEEMHFYDYSAYDFVDSMNGEIKPQEKYVGFRLIFEKSK